MQRRVVVTGMGIVSSIGQNIRDFGAALKQGRSGIGRFRTSIKPLISYIGAKITDFSFQAAIQRYNRVAPPEVLQKARRCALRSPFTVQASVLSTLEAWQQAQLYARSTPPHRMGIVIAGSNLAQCYQYGLEQKFRQAPQFLNPRYALHFMDTDHVGTLSEIFRVQGEGFTVGGASASGNVGIIKGYQLIRLGVVDVCMVVGALTDLSPMELQGFLSIGALGGNRFHDEPLKACRPFDRDREGFIYGQASGCLVLESFDSAKKRGVNSMAEILGGALVLDGNRLSDPCEDGEVRAMESALKQVKIKPADVDYLNTHGTSSPLGDEIEIKAIKRVFKECISHLWMNSTKGLTGHCLFSAGIVEGIATIIQMQKGFVHPNVNLENPIDHECRFSREKSLPASLNIAMSNSFGFGGINTSVILKRREDSD